MPKWLHETESNSSLTFGLLNVKFSMAYFPFLATQVVVALHFTPRLVVPTWNVGRGGQYIGELVIERRYIGISEIIGNLSILKNYRQHYLIIIFGFSEEMMKQNY